MRKDAEDRFTDILDENEAVIGWLNGRSGIDVEADRNPHHLAFHYLHTLPSNARGAEKRPIKDLQLRLQLAVRKIRM